MWRPWTLLFLVLSPPLVAATDPPNVILITLDTVRADRMGFLGSKRGLTPNLDEFARRSVVYERSYSQAPLTPVSHATILSGTYPRFHGVRDFGSRLPDGVPYLPQLLHAQGYRTAAFVSSIILDPQNGFAPGFERGFEIFDAGFHRTRRGQMRLGTMQRRAEETVARALAWMAKNDREPFFLWIHVWDAHDPYDPPSPFKEHHSDAPYDGCVAYVDAAVGDLFTQLGKMRMYDGSLIAVLGDHGESLGEHGENTHGVFLYDSTIRVPLVIKYPGEKFAGQKISARASLVDVAPTILAALHLPVPREMQGESLIPRATAKTNFDRPSFAESEYSRRGFGWSSLEALRTERFLFVKAPQAELYDEASDAAQNHNLSSTNKLMAVRLATELDRFAKRAGTNAPEAARVELDSQSAEKLRALGYMPSSGGGTSSSEDPKTHIQVANDLHEANLRIEEGRESTAVPLLERVVSKDPQIPHAQYFLGVAYKELREYDKAIAHLDQAIRLVPDSMMAHYEIALALYQKGELKTAATHLEIVVQHSPDWADARFSLASIYSRTDRIAEALSHLDITLQLDPDHYRANLLRGRILSLAGDSAGSLANLQKAVRVEPNSAEAHDFLAEAYSKLGREDDAARERAEGERLRSAAHH